MIQTGLEEASHAWCDRR